MEWINYCCLWFNLSFDVNNLKVDDFWKYNSLQMKWHSTQWGCSVTRHTSKQAKGLRLQWNIYVTLPLHGQGSTKVIVDVACNCSIWYTHFASLPLLSMMCTYANWRSISTVVSVDVRKIRNDSVGSVSLSPVVLTSVQIWWLPGRNCNGILTPI